MSFCPVSLLKLKKSLKLEKGSKINLYGNDYKVISSNEDMTFVIDCKNHPLAYKTKFLKSLLMETGMKKAIVENDNPNIIHGSSKGVSDRVKAGVGLNTKDNVHAGMIRIDKVDSNGKAYHYWVHAQHGTIHDDSGKEVKRNIGHKELHFYSELNNKLKEKLDPSKHEEFKKKFDDFANSKSRYNELKAAQTGLAKKQGVDPGTVHNVAAKQNEYKNKFKSLLNFVKKNKKGA